jgi:hypothetical protein
MLWIALASGFLVVAVLVIGAEWVDARHPAPSSAGLHRERPSSVTDGKVVRESVTTDVAPGANYEAQRVRAERRPGRASEFAVTAPGNVPSRRWPGLG